MAHSVEPEDSKLTIDVLQACFQNLCILDSSQSIKEHNLEFQKATLDKFKVVIIKSDNWKNEYVNASGLINKTEGKSVKMWLKTEKNKVEHFRKLLELEYDTKSQFSVYFDISSENEDISGTYLHPDLFVHFASWISSEFAFNLSKNIKQLSCENKELKKEVRNKDEQIDDLSQKVRIKEDNLRVQTEINAQLLDVNTQLRGAIAGLRELASPAANNEDLNHCLVIFYKNEPKERYPYYVFRRQMGTLQRAIDRKHIVYPNWSEIYRKENDPNAVKLYNLIKQELDVEFHGNHFSTSLPRQNLINEINRLYTGLLRQQLL